MFSQLTERRMHVVRWILTIAWLLIIASLFYDPWTSALTEPNHPWSPLRLSDSCILVQGKCLVEQPYPLATTLFWGAIVPASIFILLVFGHEVWRRICPLSFLSQIPRALGKQRQFKRENPNTGKVRYELAKVKSDSWLGKNYPYVQFGWLFVGLCGRILFFNADRLVLALWILFTIAAAITVGYLYGGKSWCNYFCPMAPVQQIYSEPGGLFGSKAHISDTSITQSMCRTVLPDGKEQSACVACQNPCIDIDSERVYWDSINKPEVSWLRYGYVGLVIGYFVYYYLYAGSWDYYISGAWARQTDQLSTLLSPGFYLFGQAINIPKIVAVPLTLSASTFIGYRVGRSIEQSAKAYSRKRDLKLSPDIIRHRVFTLCTFFIFNFFFIFGGRPLVQLMPIWGQYVYELTLVLLSTLWVYKTWRLSPDLYSRENLASRFRKQLEKLQLNISQYVEGRSLSELNTHEVYILAKVLPGFTREKRHAAYKGVVREALEEGYANYSSSLEVLQQLRQELGITDDEHREVLEELGIEDPELLNPDRQRSLENQIRLTGYRKSLERLMLLQRQQDLTNPDPNSIEIDALRRQYSISSQDEDWILSGISPESGSLRRAEFLLAQLPDLITCFRGLNQPILHEQQAVLTLLKSSIHHKKELIVRTILETLASLKNDLTAISLAQKLGDLAPVVLLELLESENWHERLHPEIIEKLAPLSGTTSSCAIDYSNEETLRTLAPLLDDRNPLIQTACLYITAQLDLAQSQAIARNYTHIQNSPLLQETVKIILSASKECPPLTTFSLLEKVVHLFNSDFFHRMHSETLISLSERAEVRTFGDDEVITEAGDTCRELLLLIEGSANILYHLPNQEVRIERLKLGQTLDELEVLAHSDSKNTIVAKGDFTRILAMPVNAFDDLLDRDRDFARRVLELESRQLQRFMRSLQTI
ncbi:cyclic nucleotide-binding domain-containing protein [Chamaesiphon polymorphus]|uniref:Cyclic nucleotide-binding protein n=1 Tax=Chamaesiphon polymorphus CCALA 037 TaxID=2107692 RepID=A0A2T1G322_9CYAN|nr:cyclic nucleotide-binding domain-containing protein [Chamaesiphon polymorphus]PSB51635.1 cyclic nucleotide-binding protein [Chamaesiphon polymorphus CCALA 037]